MSVVERTGASRWSATLNIALRRPFDVEETVRREPCLQEPRQCALGTMQIAQRIRSFGVVKR